MKARNTREKLSDTSERRIIRLQARRKVSYRVTAITLGAGAGRRMITEVSQQETVTTPSCIHVVQHLTESGTVSRILLGKAGTNPLDGRDVALLRNGNGGVRTTHTADAGQKPIPFKQRNQVAHGKG